MLAHPKPLSPAQDAVLDALVAIIKYCAAEHDISPTSLASRRELEQVVRGQDTPLLHGWRKPLAGERVQAFLNGQLELAGSPSGLQLQSKA